MYLSFLQVNKQGERNKNKKEKKIIYLDICRMFMMLVRLFRKCRLELFIGYVFFCIYSLFFVIIKFSL